MKEQRKLTENRCSSVAAAMVGQRAKSDCDVTMSLKTRWRGFSQNKI